jgi:small subunit ribosomal protein S2
MKCLKLIFVYTSLRSVGVIAGVLGRAGQSGKTRRLEEAKKGSVSWSTPPALLDHILKEQGRARSRRKEIMGRIQNAEGFNDDEEAILRSRFGLDPTPEVSEEDMVQMLGETASKETEQSTETKTE